jgi:hypothetical protein
MSVFALRFLKEFTHVPENVKRYSRQTHKLEKRTVKSDV